MATMKTIVIKNNSGSVQEIADLGISIANSSQVTFDAEYDIHKIMASDDLRDLVTAGDLVVNNGTSDLSSVNGVNHLYGFSKYESLDTHYTKTQLQTSGQASLHWDNVTNAPSFGSVTWSDPVQYRVTAIQATAPGSPSTGDVFVDTDDQHYYKYNGASWDDIGAATADDRVIKLDEADEAIFVFDGVTTWADQGTSSDDVAVMVGDDGDGKQAQYIYSLIDTAWKKIGDVDFAGHFDGTANKHDASEIDVETSRTTLGITAPTDLESALGNIDTAVGAAQTAADAAQSDIDDHVDGTANKHDASEIDVETSRTTLGITAPTDLESALGNIDTALGGWSLDKAYDTSAGSGAGRTINADSGPIKLDRGASTDATLELAPKASLPTTNLADGQVEAKDGMLWVYDATRSLWLSANRMTIQFSVNGTVNVDRFLYSSKVIGSLSGDRMIRDAVITGISCQLSTSGTVDVNIRKNDVATDILTLSVSAAAGAQSGTSNINLTVGDWVSCFIEPTGAIHNPVVTLEYAWRG